MKRKYMAGGIVEPDNHWTNCLGSDGDHHCEKKRYCERYTRLSTEHPANYLEYEGIYQGRCSYFIPNTEGLKRYFVKVGEWEL